MILRFAPTSTLRDAFPVPHPLPAPHLGDIALVQRLIMMYSKISTVLLTNHYAMACQSGQGLHHQPRGIPIVDQLSECGKL